MALSSEEIEALLAEPALEAPSGITPNFDNPPNQNDLAWFVTTFCTVIMTIAFFLRLYAKWWMSRKVHVEEVLMVLAYGAYWGTAYAGYALIYTPGYYVHQWNLYNRDLIRPLYLILVYGCSYSAVLPLLKTAILLDWCRIFVPGDRLKSPFWWGCMFVIVLQVVWGAACIILLNMQCVPHAAIWKFYLPSKCYDLPKVMLTSASVQVFSDWAMVILPQRIIWGLHMNWQKKLGISIIFGVGLLASISACVRLDTTVTFSKEADVMYYIGPLLFWACAEMTCGFFILSVPCIPAILKEHGISPKIRKALGLSSKSSPNITEPDSKAYGSSKPHPSHGLSKSGLTSVGTYYQIDEEDGGAMPLGALKTSESQEQLHTHQAKNTMQVTRTTHIAVTSDSHSAQSGSDIGDNGTPWTK